MASTEAKTAPDETWTAADKKWEYKFGCDGLRKNCDAAKFLGVSPDSIYRLIKADKIRVGTGGQVCFRSLVNHAHSLEA